MKWPTLVQLEAFPIFLLILLACLVSATIFSAANIDEGCYQLRKTSILQPPPGNYKLSEITPYQCVMMCATSNGKLAGVTNGALCVCSDTVAETSSICNQSCTGDPSLNCGGLTALRMFNLSTLLRNEPNLQFSSTPKFLEKADYQASTVNETTSYGYQLTFKATGFLNEANTHLIFGKSYSYNFTAWGSDVELTVVVIGKVRQEFRKTVDVKAPLTVSNIKCPTHVTVGFPIECMGQLNLGKEVNMTWLLDGSSGSMNVADPVSWYIGDPVPRWIISGPGADLPNGLVISLTTGVTHSVIVYAWELNVNKSGSLDIVALRPSCGIGTTYCPTTTSCCLMNNEFSSELCNEETAFCGTTTVGISSENCSSSDVNNPVPLFHTYTPIHTSTLDVDVGYNMVVLSPEKRFEYLPGDILGWIKTSSGAALAVDSNHGEYNVLETVTSLPTGNITLSLSHRKSKQVGTVLIAGVASKPTAFIVNITALSAPGVKNISFTHQTSEETLTLNRSVSALYPVGNISFTTASNSCAIYGPLNEAFNISINFHGGTNANVMWNVNNITVESSPYLTLDNQNEITWQQDFTLSSIGEYPLIVLVTNGVGGKLLTATVIIQEKITGLNATKANDSKVVYQGLSTQLTVSISTGNNVTYKWYFGDGSDVVTVTDNTVDHSYHKFGQINTTVEATNMVSSVNYSFIVNVSNPVRIIVPAYAVSNVSTNITCKLAENLLQTYIIVLQVDNESMQSSNCNTIEHVFTPGLHDIHCYIHTAVVLYSNTSLFVVEPITGLSILDIPPLALDTKHTVTVNISAGNNVTYEWQVSEKRYDAYFNSSYPITFNQHGQINLTVHASNAISMKSAETIVTVQEPIGKLTINSSANPAKTDVEIYFVINQTTGSEVNYTVNISTSEYYRDLGPTATFTYTFPQERTYNIFISATNLISSSNTTYPITVQVPVKRHPEITCPSVSLKDKTCVVSTTKTWPFKAEIPYATNVTFEWTWGGQQDTTTDYSPSTSPSNITSTQNKSFLDPRTFRITVIAKNNVSSLSNVLHVETLDEVSGFTFKFPQAVAVNTNFTINASIAKGSNVTYSYDFGVNRRKNSVADRTVSWNYEKVGVYQIKGTASNLVNNDTTSHDITVQQEITGVFIEKISTVETNKPTDIKWNVTGGTNVTSNLNFGDATSETIKYTKCQLHDPTSTYSCTTTHTWSENDTYKVRIHANNLLTTTKSASIHVTLQHPVEGFSVKINSSSPGPYYYMHQGIPLIFTQTKGSNVKYRIYLNDDGRIDNTSKTNPNIKYYKKGVYKPWFVAYNDISSTKYKNLKEITIRVPREPKEIIGLKVSAKPTKFNTTTKFDMSYEDGALFKCSIDFGDGKNEDILEEELNKGVSYRYTGTGSFTAQLRCENTKGNANLKKVEIEVFVHTPIEGFKLDNSTISAVYKEAINIQFSWRQASDMKVIAYAENNQVVPAREIDYKSRSGIIVLHKDYFSSPNRYIIRVNASNKVSSLDKPAEATVNIIEKISGVKVLFNPFVAVSYGLRAYLSVGKGSDMKVTWNFGDGSPDKTINCTWKESCFFDHTYNKTGKYLITARAQNELSSGDGSGNVIIEYPILGWRFVPVDISRADVPSELKLVYNDSFTFPTDVTYEITFDQDNQNGAEPKKEKLTESGSAIVKHIYQKAGCYRAKVKMENKVSTVVLETIVKVRGNYGTAKITPNSLKGDDKLPLPLEYPVKFTPNIENSCLKYNWTIKDNDSKVLTVNFSKSFEYTFNVSGEYKINFIAYDSDNMNDNITAETEINVDKSVTGLFLSSDGVGEVNKTVNFILLWATLGTTTTFTIYYDDGNDGETLHLMDKTKNFSTYNSKLPFNPNGLEGIIFSHNFTEISKYEVKVNVNSGQELKTQVSISKKPCPLPVITVTGGSKDANRAPQVPYEIQYTLFSTVAASRIDCDENDFKWRIFRADEYLLKTTGSSVIPPDDNREVDYTKFTVARNQSTLAIPRKTLHPGLYIFQLNVNLQDATSQHIVYVKIKRPPLIVEIEGGSARSIAWNAPFTLNANLSVDPLTGNNKDLSFEWRCKLKGMQEKGGCFGAGELLSARNGERKTTFRKKLLLEGITYQFTVRVYDAETSRRYTQEINAIPGKPPQLKLRCVSNCAPKINPDARLSITSECISNCEGLRYNWTLDNATSSETSKNIWPNRTLTEKRSASLVVKAKTFKLKQVYIFKLVVTNDHEKTGFVSYKVETNSPPNNGKCNFTPKSGLSMNTSFTFSCSDWQDDATDPDAILFYKVFYSLGDDKQNYLLYHGPESTVSDLRLPAGPDKFSNSFNLSINVEDAFKAYSSEVFTIQVKPVNVSLDQLKNSTNDVEKLIGSGDIQAANRLAIAVIQAINSSRNATKESEKEKKKKAEIFKSIVKNVAGNLPQDLDSMRQSIETVVVAITVQGDDVPQDTQDASLSAFLKTSKKLKDEAKEDLSNDIIEEVSQSLMTGIGNILKASSTTQAKIHERQKRNETVPPVETEKIDNNVGTAFAAVTVVSASILTKKVADEKDVVLTSKNLEASLRRSSSKLMNGSSVKFSPANDAQIHFPTGFDAESLGSEDVVDVVGLFLRDNPYQTLNTSKFVDSSSVSLEIKKPDGTLVKVQNLSEHLTIAVPRPTENDSISINKTETKLDELVVHALELNFQNNAFIVEICPDDPMANVTIYGRREGAPTLEKYNFHRSFQVNSTKHQHFLGNETINGVKYYVGVGSGVQMNYTFKSYEIGCYYYDKESKSWTTQGCTPSSNSTKKVVQCLCNHATLFGSSFFVAPNKLDVAAQIDNLANLADYPALLATICVIGGLYLIGMIWALRKDRKKSYKATLHCAADNEPYDNHKYEVTLFTGSRRNAGSTAEVSIIITGDNGDSEPRLLQRTSSVSFKRTSQDSYLVTTAYDLGSLQYIRIWHDNSGSDPSWFLSEVIIRDVETGEQYFFLCNSWLACDEGDGLVERLIPVASTEELKDFQYLFMQNSTEGFSDGHLWFSIVLRPAQSRFTHAQRVTCCLCLLLCTMLVNAMFFKVPVAAENNVDVDVGPYQFTWHEVMVGIQSSLIVFPINLLIVSIFRRIAVRPTKSSKYLSGNSSGKPKKTGISISLGEIDMEKKNTKKAQNKNQADQTPNVETQQPTVRMRLLPWWFVFIAWFLVIATSVTAGFFTILYGLQFGKRRQEQWLTALVISVFQDILVSQPIKIFALSLFVAFVIRKPNNVDVNEENDKLMRDEEWIQESLHRANPDGIVRTKTQRKPPDELVLRKMRLFRQKERKMFGVFREVLQFFFFWWIVLMIAYGHREPDAHRLSTSMEKTFVDLGGDNDNFTFQRGSLKHDIYMAKDKRDLLMWVREVIIPGLYHEKWYNNMTDKHHSFISDGVGYLIGSARLRLLRIKNDACNIAKEFEGKFDGCETEYSFSDEYREKYNSINWGPSNSSASNSMWQYTTQSELYEIPFRADLATYRGGGYVLKLNKKKDEAIKQLEKMNETWWIDGETRAVFVEFSLFYPGKNLHCIITILFECPASGGCTPSFRIQATRLDELIGNYRIFVLACELVFVLSIAIFTYKAVKDIVKQGAKYWYQFWNWVEMCIIGVGWTCLAFYILRLIANKWTKAKFNDNPDTFVSFRYVATADQLYGVVIAVLVFLASIKFLRLFRFNRRMSLLGSTLKYAAWDMFNFLFLFGVAFVACVCVAYLLFHTNIDMFSSFLNTTETLLNIILGKFKYMNLSHDTFLASAVILSVYCVVVVFLLMNVFLVILNDAFKVVKNDNDLQENEHEIVDYMTSRFKSFLGFRSKISPTVSDFEHEYGFKPTYVPPVKKKYQVPATAILDRKLQELLDFVEKQAHRDDMENMRVDQVEDEAAKKKALLLLMS